MCGVGGIYTFGGKSITAAHRQALQRMDEALFRRGPDAGGSAEGDSFAMVHRRLSIIDLDDRSNQPMESTDWILSYNGEIYNFRAVRDDLKALGHRFRTESDTEVLLLALQEWGMDGALARCAGMYAFLAYYKPENTFYAVRDPMGIKPLFMCRFEDGAYGFASSVAALSSAWPQYSATYDPAALGSFFSLGAPFTQSAVLSGIERLEPATYVRCQPDGKVRHHRYWRPRYREDFTMDDLISIVREYDNADVPSALLLSGGVDSTFLATLLEKVDFFHLHSPERDHAAAVAAKFRRPLIDVRPDTHQYLSYLDDTAAFSGEPMMSAGIPYSVSREIAGHGYKMALSANGADELFLGYPRTPAPEFKPDYLPLYEPRSFDWFAEQVAHIYRDNRHFEISALSGFLPSLEDIGRQALARFGLDGFPASASHRWFELMTYVQHDLNYTLDAASMANSIEMRVPFLDHRIVEGVLSWPADRLMDPALGRKAPLKRHLGQYFPTAFFSRPKLGFSIHADSHAEIARLTEGAMARARKSRLIKLKNVVEPRFYKRDQLYLSSCLLAYESWCRAFPQAAAAA